jgi:hypothetical protein
MLFQSMFFKKCFVLQSRRVHGLQYDPRASLNGRPSVLLTYVFGLHCKACLGEIEQYNYNVSLLDLFWSFRNLGVKM